MPETTAATASTVGVGVVPGFLQAIEKEGKGPFTVGAAVDHVEPFGVDGYG